MCSLYKQKEITQWNWNPVETYLFGVSLKTTVGQTCQVLPKVRSLNWLKFGCFLSLNLNIKWESGLSHDVNTHQDLWGVTVVV